VAGRLIVVATPIGNLGDISARAAGTLRDADVVLAEDTRRTGKLLEHVGSRVPQRSFHEHNERDRIEEVLRLLEDGKDVALVSDAGTPVISDPGYRLVAAAAEAGHRIEPVPGPSAVLAALAVSGLPSDRVVFEGFLPRKGATRRQRLAELADERRTIVLFASPHRGGDDLADLADALGGDRRAVVARELTKLHEEVLRGTLGELAESAAEGLRGELTVVIAGASRVAASPGPDELVARVRELIATGTPKKAAIAAVAAAAGVPKRDVYQAVLEADG
jgi:16S rRNA (cytidine1402-2'-O)-methyltransferase